MNHIYPQLLLPAEQTTPTPITSITMTTIADYKSRLRAIGAKVTHPNRAAYAEYMASLEWYKSFPWRPEQTAVFDAVDAHDRIVVQGIFGAGKSTMLIGIVFKALIEKHYKPRSIMYTAFNVCVKNEIRRKFSSYGIRNKIQVFTFDSLVYKICAIHGCPGLDEPNYEGRRKFVYNLIATKTACVQFNFRLVILDESQDLEIQALDVFTTFFPRAKFVFMGDVLQSIQREPRESLLWQLISSDKYTADPDTAWRRMFMYETPRVPTAVLKSVSHALSSFYPEFKTEFQKWTSTNRLAGHMEWRPFKNYKQMFSDVVTFVQTHGHTDTMVLTFSSSITVRGALGDVSRIRNLLCEHGIPVNFNHKSMDADKVFLSTSNSSKGLERKHVLVVLTFPMEQAFMNFSNDLVMNLITVALTRAIETVTVYVPTTAEKFTPVLSYYENVPEPVAQPPPPPPDEQRQPQQPVDAPAIGAGNSKPRPAINDFSLGTVMDKEHSVTEILRLGVLKYETLAYVKSFAKPIVKHKLSDEPFKINLFTDEKRTLAGVFVEHLITTQWAGAWPDLASVAAAVKDNPVYAHCSHKIERLFGLYTGLTRARKYTAASVEYQTRALHVYSQLLLAVDHRIFVQLSDADIAKISGMWKTHWRTSVMYMKAAHDTSTPPSSRKVMIQSNCAMPFVKGIIDMLTVSTRGGSSADKTFANHTFWEIKASADPLWHSDALSQAMLYVLANAKARCTVILINPFRNQVCKYSVRIPAINTVRHRVIHDCVIYNANSYMAKTFKTVVPAADKTTLDLLQSVFVHTQDHADSKSATVLRLFSPTKLNIVSHVITKGTESKLGRESDVVSVADGIDMRVLEGKTVYVAEDCILPETFDTLNVVRIERFDHTTGESFNTARDPFMQAVANILHLFSGTKFVY